MKKIAFKFSFIALFAAAAILLHSLFDFDLEFISVFLILAVCMTDTSGAPLKIGNRSLTAAASVYFSAALSLSYFGRLGESLAMYPFNTECGIKLMEATKDADALGRRADAVLRLNKSVADAYASKAASDYMKGDFGGFIENMREALDRAPFDYKLHENYCYLLMSGTEYYEKSGDAASADICRKEISNAVTRYKKTLSEINPLYKKTVISPVFSFPDDIEAAALSGD